MLHTSLDHILTKADFDQLLKDNDQVMICCGRMGPMCIPVYAAMTALKQSYPNIRFADMEFDIPVASEIRNAPQAKGFMGLPFTFYYKNGEVVAATSSIQNKEQITKILDKHFK
ncbi:MAG: thioredoxin family protein [Prolixibacteraceae bacterium]|nr:thioredoxin family protein [Prolixibacteraceae bacterium]